MRFNLPVLEDWLNRHKPYPMEKLAEKTGLSVSGIAKIRRVGNVPRPENLQSLAEVLGKKPAALVLFTEPTKRKNA